MQQLHRIFALALASLVGMEVVPGARGQPIIELDAVTFKQSIDNQEFDVIVDVRTSTEWESGHIEGATLVENLSSFGSSGSTTAEIIGTPDDLNGCQYCDIAVYCRSGARAGGALRVLRDAGFLGRLYNGQGVSQWTDAGYPLVGLEVPSATPPCTVDANATERCFLDWLEYTGNSVQADDATPTPATAAAMTPTPSTTTAPVAACGSAAACDDCLASGCAWAEIDLCLDSCSDIADIGCYSSEFFEGTPGEICAVAAADKNDRELCQVNDSDCATCTNTVKSDGNSTCEWYDDGTDAWCGTGGCDQVGNCALLECKSATVPTSAPVVAAVDPAPAPVPNNWFPTTWDSSTITAAPVSVTDSTDADCELYSACLAQNLTGLCCPTDASEFLDCCGVTAETDSPGPEGTGAPVSAGGGAPPAPFPTPAPSTSLAPTGSLAPFLEYNNSQCADNTACNALTLIGSCCPTIDDLFLDCCDGVVKDQSCQRNEQCDALNLTGACCPTNDGFGYLDCCNAFPVDCIDGNCNITSATDYLEFVADGGSASGSCGMHASTVSFFSTLFAVWYTGWSFAF